MVLLFSMNFRAQKRPETATANALSPPPPPRHILIHKRIRRVIRVIEVEEGIADTEDEEDDSSFGVFMDYGVVAGV